MTERALMSLFEGMDAAADKLPRGVAFIHDCQIEFRQRQKVRHPDLSQEQWTDLFALWTAHYQGRECAKHAAAQARSAELCDERRNLFIVCAFMPPSAATAAANERLLVIGRELAAIHAPKRPLPPLGSWV